MKKKDARIMERHHRLPRSRGGHHTTKGKRDNVTLVERELHRAWHLLFGNMEAPEVAAMITDTWCDPDYYLVAVPRDRKQPKGKRCRQYCTDCQCEVLRYVPAARKKKPQVDVYSDPGDTYDNDYP